MDGTNLTGTVTQKEFETVRKILANFEAKNPGRFANSGFVVSIEQNQQAQDLLAVSYLVSLLEDVRRACQLAVGIFISSSSDNGGRAVTRHRQTLAEKVITIIVVSGECGLLTPRTARTAEREHRTRRFSQ